MLGTGHSFNDMADSPGAQVTLAGLPPEVSVDSAASLARVAAGLSYAEVAGRLDRLGFALRNLASLPHISVAGACATATHGSGAANQNLAAAVAGLTLVTADGDLLELTRRDEALGGAAVHLGALGAVSSLLLEVVPSFDVAQRVYEDLPLEILDDHFAALMAAGYSVSMFTDWRAPRLTQVWIKQRLDAPPAPLALVPPVLVPPVPVPPALVPPVPVPPVTHEPWFTATLAPAPRHPVPGVSADACTEQLGLPGRWYERLPHFRPELRPSVGRELQSEYLLSAAHAVPALHALSQIRDRLAPVLRICEIRAVAADELWLSPSYRQAQRGVPLHLDRRHRRGAPGGRPGRTAADPVRAAAALGQDFHHRARGSPRTLRAPAGLPCPDAPPRPLRQVPQRLYHPLPEPLASDSSPRLAAPSPEKTANESGSAPARAVFDESHNRQTSSTRRLLIEAAFSL